METHFMLIENIDRAMAARGGKLDIAPAIIRIDSDTSQRPAKTTTTASFTKLLATNVFMFIG
jgi:hypothetical protein